MPTDYSTQLHYSERRKMLDCYGLMDKLYLPRCPLLDKIEATGNLAATLPDDHLCQRCLYAQLGFSKAYGWGHLYLTLTRQLQSTPDSVLLHRQMAQYAQANPLPTLEELDSRPKRYPLPSTAKLRPSYRKRF